MADRLLTKTNLLSLALLAAVMHAAAGMMRYLLPMDQFTESMMDLPLMAAAVSAPRGVGSLSTSV